MRKRSWGLLTLAVAWLGYRIAIPRLVAEREPWDRGAAAVFAVAGVALGIAYLVPLWRRFREIDRRTAVFSAIFVIVLTGVSTLFGALLIVVIGWWRFPAYLRSRPSYAKFQSETAEARAYPPFDEAALTELGWAQEAGHHPRTSYQATPAEKPAGTIRIGLFGDSFTEGDEAATDHDYATFLQREFREHGQSNVQVINFGVHAFGFHQTVRMWEILGRRYDLDYTVMMPFNFHRPRDNSFISNANDVSPLHLRYVLDGAGVRRLQPLGGNWREATRRYFQRLPPWQYWRYDHAAPPLLQAFLIGGVFPFNPFYYRHDDATELKEVDARLVRSVAAGARNLILIANDPEILSWRENPATANAIFLESRLPDDGHSFAYRAPFGHLSALGNELRARELYAFLAGQERVSYPVLRFSDWEGDASRPVMLQRRATTAAINSPPVGTRLVAVGQPALPLSAYDTVSVGIAGKPLTALAAQPVDGPTWRCQGLVDFRADKVASVLVLPWNEPQFAPLRFLLRDGAPVALRFRAGDRQVEIPVGHVEATSPVLGRVRVEPPRENRGAGWSLDMQASDFLHQVKLPATVTITDVAIAIDGEIALTGQRRPRTGWRSTLRDLLVGRPATQFELRPVISDFAVLRGIAGQYLDVRQLPESSGRLAMILSRNGRPDTSVPLPFRYHRTQADSVIASAPRHNGRDRIIVHRN